MLREVARGTGISINFNIRQRAGRAAPAKPLTTARSARLAERERHKGLAGGPPGRSHKPRGTLSDNPGRGPPSTLIKTLVGA